MPQTPEEMVAYARQLKEDGNALFKQKDYKKALSKYSKIQLFTQSLITQGGGAGEEA